MTPLFSTRLQLIPLSESDLEHLLTSRRALEISRGLTVSNLELNAENGFMEEFAEATRHFVLPNVKAHPEAWFWYTNWLIVHREWNLTIGGIGVAGPPDNTGQTMIGYFMDRKFEGQNYTTEAVGCFVDWLFQHPDVQTVVADTPVNHVASQRVLQKNGFRWAGEVEEGIRWRKSRPA
ncbi:GNAT family N-acetyltransferase [Larkinella insperata]|uniref:GNAT family N-acetyltransferase n=1 Tax=Larkinella insperata TaxID=332158 RepID=A0ABW3Q5F7_9BACT|nr:GNAT family N-acetyltransferase [Larkinella insperata]